MAEFSFSPRKQLWEDPNYSFMVPFRYAERQNGVFVGPPEKPVDWDVRVFMDESHPLHSFRKDVVNQIENCRDGNGCRGFSYLDARRLAKSVEALIDAKIAALLAEGKTQ